VLFRDFADHKKTGLIGRARGNLKEIRIIPQSLGR
jgi:hypothetical protein